MKFALGGVDELPGQRLSKTQVDAFAPFFANEFNLDESFVRQQLAQVYLYVGGPVPAGNAMTIGHHIFVPDTAALTTILSPRGIGWLSHELAHTMQFLSYQNGNAHHFLADYVTGLMIGRDPEQPGTGHGSPVWGSGFTGLNLVGGTEKNIGDQALTLKGRLNVSLVPGALLGLPAGLAAGGLLAAGRASTALPILGTMPGPVLGLGVIGAPAIVGALAGAAGVHLGVTGAQAIGVGGGAAVAGALLWRSGAFSANALAAAGSAGGTIGTGMAVATGVAGVVAGAAVGWLSATASADSVRGTSHNATILNDLARSHTETPKTLDYKMALHDAHWQEIDAEAVSREYLAARDDGRLPDSDTSTAGRVIDMTKATAGDRLDWGVKLPLIVGVPTAIAAGTGVLVARTGTTLFNASVRDGKGPVEAIRCALKLLGDTHGGIVNSMGVGAAITLAPLV
ncbi:MAG: hypothetical protein JWN41_1273, partial [Thermoleophilia bacterium]|nr:hypothetical protein [Thermoleophilia bacterium]